MADAKARPNIKFELLFGFMSLVALVAGIYLTFFHSKGFVKTEATIVSIETIPAEFEDDDDEHVVTVSYVVDGKTYTEVLDSYSPSYKEGKVINVAYDPNHPETVHGQGFAGIYCILVGVVLLGAMIFSKVKEKKALQEQEEKYGETTYLPSVKGEQRELYFLTDRGTAKYGHRIEDENGKVLFEAKMTKFTVTTPYGFDFIDHVNNETKPHLVGHEVELENTTLLFDNHYTFTIDGEDVWKHLKKHGISVQTRFDEDKPLWLHYTISRDGAVIAEVDSSSYHVHEKDEERAGGLSTKIPVRGYYRIFTAEQNLDLLFVTLMAFARTSANDDTGGNYKLLFGKKK